MERALQEGCVPAAEVEEAARAARRWAAAQAAGFQGGLEAAGWRTNKFLLSTAERCGYQLLEDPH